MSAEEVVRKYLDYLEDPAVLRDDAAIAEAEARAEAATDKIERLRALSEVERLKSPSADDLHEAFVKDAKSWADAEGITAGAFRTVGVPPGVLVAAGFDVPGHEAPRATRRPRRATRGPGVGVDEVRAAVPGSGTFTVKELRERSGASPGTVRKAMTAMLEDGTVVDRGQDPRWDGPGRVPTLYSRA